MPNLCASVGSSRSLQKSAQCDFGLSTPALLLGCPKSDTRSRLPNQLSAERRRKLKAPPDSTKQQLPWPHDVHRASPDRLFDRPRGRRSNAT